MRLHTLAQLREDDRFYHTRLGPMTLAQACEWLEVGEIIKLFGAWAVTDYGVECLVEFYQIATHRLNDPYWLDHMAQKSWVSAGMLRDLERAIDFAKSRLAPISGAGLTARFAVLKRDGYRCQICGRTADDGVKLEVDHKIPRAKGGKDTADNLWTLCFDCNRGKRTSDL